MKNPLKYLAFILFLIVTSLALFMIYVFGMDRWAEPVGGAQQFSTSTLASLSNKDVPRYDLTPGKAETLLLDDLTKSYNGQTYSQAHRNVSDKVKKQVYEEYGVSYPQPEGKYEVDHFIPLAMGGSNDISNLWLQPGNGVWNYHDKDKLETFLVSQVKKGKIKVVEAQKCIVSDWVICYKKYKMNLLGGSSSWHDSEDDIH